MSVKLSGAEQVEAAEQPDQPGQSGANVFLPGTRCEFGSPCGRKRKHLLSRDDVTVFGPRACRAASAAFCPPAHCVTFLSQQAERGCGERKASQEEAEVERGSVRGKREAESVLSRVVAQGVVAL